MAGKNYQIKATLRGRDQASSVFARIGRNARRHLGGAFKMVGGIFSKLKNTLTSLPVLGGLLGGALGVGGIISWVKDWAAAGDAIAKTSRAAGVSARFFQELGDVAGHAGVGTEEFASSLTKANVNLGLLRTGGGPLVGLLKKVSPALLKTLQGTKSTEEGVTTLLDAMSKLKDPAKRAVLAQAAFGKSGVKMALLAEQGTEAIRAQIKEFRALGGAISDEGLKGAEDFQDALQRVGVAWSGIKNKFGSAFVKAALPWLGKLTDWFTNNQGRLGEMVEGFATDMVEGIQSVVSSLPALASALSQIAKIVSDIVGGIGKIVKVLTNWAPEAGNMTDMEKELASVEDETPGEKAVRIAGVRRYQALGPRGPNGVSLGALTPTGKIIDARLRKEEAAASALLARETLASLNSAGVAGPLGFLGPRASDLMLPAIKQASEITVKFENMPKGARVETKGTAPVRVNVGRRTQGETP